MIITATPRLRLTSAIGPVGKFRVWQWVVFDWDWPVAVGSTSALQVWFSYCVIGEEAWN